MTTSLSPRSAAPFVGREVELELLKEAHASARLGGAGARRLALVTGEVGVGKSMLIQEFCRYLRGRHERFIEGRCSPGIDQAYQPFGELVTGALSSLEHLGVDAASAERYVARLEPLLPSRRAPRSPASKWQLYDSLLEFFQELGRIAPHTFILHDLHYADPATLELLRFLAENLSSHEALEAQQPAPSAAGLFIVTSREGGAAAETLRELGRLSWTTQLRLGGLGRADVAKLLQSAPIVERLFERSGGNPHHLEELLLSLPAQVEDLFLQRAQRLSPDSRACLSALAALGRPVGAAMLTQVAGRDELAVESALAELTQARIVVRSLVSGRVHFTFAKEIHQEHYYGALGDAERRALHARAGEALESRGEQPELLATHFLRAGDPRGARYALVAAKALRRAHAYGEAADLLEQAIPSMLAAPGENALEPLREAALPHLREDALGELADLQKMRGQYGAALHALGRLMMLQPPAARATALRRAGQLLALKGSYAAAQRLLLRALGLATQAGDEHERIDVGAALAEVRYLRGEYAVAEALCVEGLASGDKLAPAARVALTNIIGKVRLHHEQFDEALQAFEENLRFSRERQSRAAATRPGQVGDPAEVRSASDAGMDEAAAHNNLGIVYLRRGEYQRAEAAYTEALAHFEALHDPAGRAFCQQNLGVLFHERADYGRALEAYHRGLAGFKRVGNKTQLTNTAINLGNLYLSVGDLSRAERLISFALDIAGELSTPLLSAYGYNLLGETLCAQGRWDAARVYLDRAQALFDEIGSRRLTCEVRLNLARLWIATGKPEKAEAALRRVETTVFHEHMPKVAGQACLLRAELCFNGGEPAKAAELYDWARELFLSDGDEEGIWRAHQGLGRVAARDGRTLEAENHYLKAKSLIEALTSRVPEDLRETYLSEPRRRAVGEELDHLSRSAPMPKRAVRVTPGTHRAEELFRAAATDLTQVRGEFAGRRPGGAYDGSSGQSRRLMNVLRMVDKVAPSSSTVLIRGESGTGKELIAEALHRGSHRAPAPFVTLNCAALVETLLLSELFGHEKGAFTGAVARKRGRFELADGGTLFLDEIGDISPKTQVALLRVLQEKQFERVGGVIPLKVDVRIVCATHRDLEGMVKAGQFREDLYFRLKGIVIELPALRERREDVPLLATHFLERALAERGGDEDGRPSMLFDEEAMELLMAYAWPGNIRELENIVRTLVLFSEGRVITRAELQSLREFQNADGRATTEGTTQAAAEATATRAESDDTAEEAVIERVLREEVGLAEMKKHLELECIKRALQRTNGNITQAAKLLQMKRPRLSQIVKEYSELFKLDGLKLDGLKADAAREDE